MRVVHCLAGLAALALAPAAWSQARLYDDLTGLSGGDGCASSVAALGDVTGDGVCDIALGCPTASPGGLLNAGQILVYSGAVGVLVYQVDGTTANDGLGASLARVGDVDADTIPDFVAGAPDSSPAGASSGRLYLISGIDGSVIRTIAGTQAGERLGEAVSGIADVDGDTLPDLLGGAPGLDFGGNSGAGAVMAFSSSDGHVIYTTGGFAPLDNFGRAVAAIADRDNDTFPDFLAGAPGYDALGAGGSGIMLVCSGATGTEIERFEGLVAGDTLGTAVASAGDINNDGWEDYLAGAQGASSGPFLFNGSVLLVSGIDMSLVWRFDGEGFFHGLGKRATGLDDVNGDGVPDVLAAAPASDAGGEGGQGSAYLLSGSDGSLIYRIDGSESNAALGEGLANLGDLDGDGWPEYAIGSPNVAHGSCRVHRAQVPAFFFDGSGDIGTLLSIDLTSNANLNYVFIYDTDPGPTDTPMGRFDIGFSPAWGFVGGLVLDPWGHSVLTDTIPNDGSIVGITLYGQCLVMTALAPNGAFLLSEGASVTFK